MNRTPSLLAQYSFSASTRLQLWAHHAGSPVRQFARAANKVVRPISRHLGRNHLVRAHLYGHDLLMPAEHPLAPTLAIFPQYNRPLGLAAQAILESGKAGPLLSVIDVGANIGETIAIIEQRCPGAGRYLCIEADREIAELCRLNHEGNDRVLVRQCFVGEAEGTPVYLQDDGRANPSTRLSDQRQAQGQDRLVRLDTAAAEFAAASGSLDLVKVDTEGYDFSVLRSAPALLNRYKPAVYFEWFPELLLGLREELWSGFDFLEAIGYRYYAFFTNQGDFECAIDSPERAFFSSLADRGMRGPTGYFDVFASTEKSVRDHLVELFSPGAIGNNEANTPAHPAEEIRGRNE